MRVESVKVAFPSKRLTNEDVLELVRQHSESSFDGDLPKALDQIRSHILRSGAETRYWLDGGERPISLLLRAVGDALADAGCQKQDIELLVYVGVDRGFLEPGGSHFVAKALGMRDVHCFDILDG